MSIIVVFVCCSKLIDCVKMTVLLHISYRSWCQCFQVHVFCPLEVLGSVRLLQTARKTR